MSTHDEHRTQAGRLDDHAPDALSPEEARLVARLADAYAPPEPTRADRARFDARLAARLAHRERPALWPWLAPAALALAVALLVTTQPRRPDDVANVPGAAATAERAAASDAEAESLLALVTGEAASEESALPEDYQAIASLMY